MFGCCISWCMVIRPPVKPSHDFTCSTRQAFGDQSWIQRSRRDGLHRTTLQVGSDEVIRSIHNRCRMMQGCKECSKETHWHQNAKHISRLRQAHGWNVGPLQQPAWSLGCGRSHGGSNRGGSGIHPFQEKRAAVSVLVMINPTWDLVGLRDDLWK